MATDSHNLALVNKTSVALYDTLYGDTNNPEKDVDLEEGGTCLKEGKETQLALLGALLVEKVRRGWRKP